MFSHRRNSQKPGDELYAAFKQNFPEVGPGSGSGSAVPGALRSSSLSEALLDPPAPHRYVIYCRVSIFKHVHLRLLPLFTLQRPTMSPILHDIQVKDIPHTDYFSRTFGAIDDNKEQDTTPRPYHDSWRLTPSLMDPNSYAFSHFANQLDTTPPPLVDSIRSITIKPATFILPEWEFIRHYRCLTRFMGYMHQIQPCIICSTSILRCFIRRTFTIHLLNIISNSRMRLISFYSIKTLGM